MPAGNPGAPRLPPRRLQKSYFKSKKGELERKIKKLDLEFQAFKTELGKLKNFNNVKWRDLVTDTDRFAAVKRECTNNHNDFAKYAKEFERLMDRSRPPRAPRPVPPAATRP